MGEEDVTLAEAAETVTSNGLKTASQSGLTTEPYLSDQLAPPKRHSLGLINIPDPVSDSFPSNIGNTDEPKLHSKSVYRTYRQVAMILFVYFAAGTLFFHLMKNQISGKKTNSVIDGLYFTILTMTSVGYGDLVPATNLAMLFSYLFVILGTLIVGFVLSKAADLIVENQERLLVKALGMNKTHREAEILKRSNTTKVRNKCIILVVLLVLLMAAGTGLLLVVEDLNFVHAFYCVMGTITGLGYIDKCFSTAGGRAFALLWILSGTIYAGQLLFTYASLRTERRQMRVVKWVLQKNMTVSDLEAADFDGDGMVVASEFVIYKLKEMGKISQDDIENIMDEFERRDFGNTGTLSVSDLSMF